MANGTGLARPAVVLLLAHCGGPSLRGAVTVENDRTVMSGPGQLIPLACRDGRGAAATAPQLTLQRVHLKSGEEAVLELRQGYDTVAITNGYEDASGRVFQYVSDDGQNPRILHTVRLTPGLTGARLVLASAFDLHGSNSEFRATAREVALECELAPWEPPPGRAPNPTVPRPTG